MPPLTRRFALPVERSIALAVASCIVDTVVASQSHKDCSARTQSSRWRTVGGGVRLSIVANIVSSGLAGSFGDRHTKPGDGDGGKAVEDLVMVKLPVFLSLMRWMGFPFVDGILLSHLR